jgi:asparagine synthase (glutamine-hydrolysing)
MCGILGAKGFTTSLAEFAGLNALLRHRGPDHARIEQVAPDLLFGHNRLAIVGLEPASNQPFTSACGRFTIVYNGEIYNYPELRQELQGLGHRFHTGSDTEVLVEAWSRWGKRCVERLNGMFAFALYDRSDDALVLVRDRLGVKPLFYSWNGDRLAFASELPPLRQLLGQVSLDATAVDAFFMLGYVPAPRTIYNEVSKLPPGMLLEMRNGRISSSRYWQPDYRSRPIVDGDEQILEQLDALLADAVRLRMRADVPVGAFLSGGIDSSLVVSYMSRFGKDVRTFTIGFDDPQHDETAVAAGIASSLGTRHRVLRLDESALCSVEEILAHFGEPFGDSSAIPTFYVSQLAAREIKVVLSGDGGDESFMGYDRHKSFKALKAFQRLPRPLRSVVRAGIGGVARVPGPAGRAAALVQRVLRHDLRDDVRFELARRTRVPYELRRQLHGCDVDASEWLAETFAFRELDVDQRSLAIDLEMSLPDDMLAKVDRMSMAHALEVRNPFLDYRVVEFALRLPMGVKMPGLATKHLLKCLARRRFGAQFVRRPKRGFAAPLSWLGKAAANDESGLSADQRLLVTAFQAFQAAT